MVRKILVFMSVLLFLRQDLALAGFNEGLRASMLFSRERKAKTEENFNLQVFLGEMRSAATILRAELKRTPDVSEVALYMKRVKGKTDYDRIQYFRIKISDYGIDLKKEGINQPRKSRFPFARIDIIIPPELNNKIKVVQDAPGPRNEATEVFLKVASDSAVMLRLVDAGESIKLIYKSADLEIARDVLKPENKKELDLSLSDSFIAFRDAILGIPYQYGEARKAALMKWLEKNGNRSYLRHHNIHMKQHRLYLPSYYARHPERVIKFEYPGKFIKILALVDSKNPENYFVLENREDGIYSAESGYKIQATSLSNRHGAVRGDYNLSKLPDFVKFDQSLDKSRIINIAGTISKRIVDVGFGRTRFNFWTDSDLVIIGVQTERAFAARPDRSDYPVILRTKEGEELRIESFEGDNTRFTVTGLRFRNSQKPVIFKGDYFNLSIIMQLVDSGFFGDLLEMSDAWHKIFVYRERKNITGKFTPRRLYDVNEREGTLNTGGLVDLSRFSL